MSLKTHQERARNAFWVTFGIYLVGLLLQVATAPSPGIVSFELAFTEARAQTLLGEWQAEGIRQAQINLRLDYLFIFGYFLFIASVLLWTLQDEKGEKWLWPTGRLLVVLTPFAAVFDVIENVLLQHVLRNPSTFGALSIGAAGTAAALKFALLGVVLVGWGYWIIRKRPQLLRYAKEWLSDLWSIVKISRASVIVLAVGVAFLVFVPQGRDIVIALAEPPLRARLKFLIWFLAAIAFWAFNIWYWARVMLRFDFGQSSAGQGRSGRAKHIREHFPRLLGMLAFLAVTCGFLRAALDTTGKTAIGHWILAAWTLVMALIFYGATMVRRQLTDKLHKRAQEIEFLQKGAAAKMIDGMGIESSRAAYATDLQVAHDLKAAVRFFLGLLFILTAAMFVMFSLDPGKGALFRSGPILLLAGAAWVPVGSLLVFLSYRLRFPLMATLLAALIIFSYTNDNHAVRTLDEERAALAPSVGDHFPRWLEARGITPDKPGNGKRYPVVIVAAEGGGIRAAYWTANVLGRLQDKYRSPDGGSFAEHVYAISGVSGGSLGGAVFAALAREQLAGANLDCKRRNDSSARKKGTVEACADRMLRGDFLSPTLAALLYPDLVQRFLPIPIPRFDRGRALEQSWERAWNRLPGVRQGLFGGSPDETAFDGLWTRAGDPEARDYGVPLLFLNTTSVETGKRVIISPVAIGDEFADAEDYFGASNRQIRLSTAVHNSARFTFVSPAGTVKTPEGDVWGHVVDGGYFENSGATTAIELLEAMQRTTPSDVWGNLQPIVLMISNDPLLGSRPAPRRFLKEALSPVVALLQTRGARGSYSRDALEDRVAEDCESRELKLGAFGDLETTEICRRFFVDINLKGVEGVPLGWVLSGGARKQMNEALDDKIRPARIALQDAHRPRRSTR